MFTQRIQFVAGAVLCMALMATALYFQHVLGLEPCPLCVFQRIFVIVVGAIMVVGAIHDPGALWRRIYALGIAVFSTLGIVVAGRHVWLQNLPADQVPECGPGLEYMLEAFPLGDALNMVFRGSGECAEVQWSFLGLTIPGWTLLIFIGLLGFSVYLLGTRRGPSVPARAV